MSEEYHPSVSEEYPPSVSEEYPPSVAFRKCVLKSFVHESSVQCGLLRSCAVYRITIVCCVRFAHASNLLVLFNQISTQNLCFHVWHVQQYVLIVLGL